MLGLKLIHVNKRGPSCNQQSLVKCLNFIPFLIYWFIDKLVSSLFISFLSPLFSCFILFVLREGTTKCGWKLQSAMFALYHHLKQNPNLSKSPRNKYQTFDHSPKEHGISFYLDGLVPMPGILRFYIQGVKYVSLHCVDRASWPGLDAGFYDPTHAWDLLVCASSHVIYVGARESSIWIDNYNRCFYRPLTRCVKL